MAILVEQGEFRGVTAIEMKTGELSPISAKAGIIATGGAGRLYSFATYGHSSTADGLAMAYRAGVPLKDMEFVQFHPSGLIPSGILITEGARADGGVLLNKDGERFMGKYAPEKLELASRDVVSRAMVTEIEQGRGFRDEASGYDYLELDLTSFQSRIVEYWSLRRQVGDSNGFRPSTPEMIAETRRLLEEAVRRALGNARPDRCPLRSGGGVCRS